MQTLWQDLRYGLRMLGASPGFTVVAVISLALGIGANSSIFSVVNAALLKPLPYKEPARLMMIERTSAEVPGQSLPWSYPKYEALRDQNEIFEQVAAFSDQNFPLTDTEDPERLQTEIVSADYFPVLGISPSAGRVFTPEEDQTPGASAVALIGYGLWQRRFGGNPGVLGQNISLNKVPFTIVGVMPKGFKGQSNEAEVWVPMMMAPALTFAKRLSSPFASWHEVIARLKPGVTQAQAQAAMGTVEQKIDEAVPWPAAWGPAPEPEHLRVVAFSEAKIDPAIRKSILILFGAVGFVLLIACLNIASLLMSRGVSRRKEIAIRLALGASRARLIRQLLTESMVLALAGGLAGLLIALWGVEILSAFKPASNLTISGIPLQAVDFSAAKIDSQVLVFNLLLSVVTGLIFGIAPALQASKTGVSDSLKEGVPGLSKTPGRFRRLNLKNLLIVTELALAVVLLIGAGLMIKSFARLHALPIGFEPANLLTLKIQLPKKTPDTLYEQLLTRVQTIPGIQSATLASSTPLSSNSAKAILKLKDQADDGSRLTTGVHAVGADYFKTLKIPLLKGRSFNGQDREGSPRVAIINETAAHRYWAGIDPVGKQIWLSVGWEQNEFAEIVGIAGDVKYGKADESAEPEIYLPYLQPTESPNFVIARTEGDPAGMIASVRQAVFALDKNVPTYDIRTMEDRIGDATSKTRFSAFLLAVFAGLALLLSAIGIYGVMTQGVAGRTREIGIRMALGAQKRDVIKMVMGEGILLTAGGLTMGLALASVMSRILASQLYDVTTTDRATFIGVSLLLGTVALVASYIPARRATKVDPMVALRYE